MKHERVAVLMGGFSAEREVSLASGAAVARGLDEAGHRVLSIDVTRKLDIQLRDADVDAAFLVLHGRWGEDGTVQGMLEMMGIPYTGSSVLASALAMDKVRTREILAARGLSVAPGEALTREDRPTLPSSLQLPVVVKPASEGSSVGVSIVRDQASMKNALEAAWDCCDQALVEKYVTGAEVNVAVLDGEVLGAVEIEPHAEFYDYGSKYDDGGSSHHIPPRLPQEKIDLACDLARRAFEAVGCAGAARVDLILPRDDDPIILEVNTIPGMTTTSLLPEIAAHAGITFPQLVSRMAEAARLHV